MWIYPISPPTLLDVVVARLKSSEELTTHKHCFLRFTTRLATGLNLDMVISIPYFQLLTATFSTAGCKAA